MAPVFVNATNQSGYGNYEFNPDCNYYPGNWIWYAGVTDGYYQNLNTTQLNVTITESITNQILSPTGNETLRAAT